MASTDNCIKKLFGIQGLIVNNLEQSEKEITFFMELERKEQHCPNCNAPTNCVHDYRTQRVKEVAVLGKPTILVLRKRRYRCLECGKRFMEQNEMIQKYGRMTKRLMQHICDKLQTEYSFTSVARENNVSVNTVIRVFDKCVPYPDGQIPEVISIDEFRGNTGKQKYQCIITDPKKKRVLDILPSRYTDRLKSYFRKTKETIRNKVCYFISDMWKPYVELAKHFFPNATRVIDKYHWIRQVIWAFEAVRKKEQKKYSESNRIKFKRARTLLNKRYAYLSPDDKQRVDDMLALSAPLKEAHTLKESFFQALDSKSSDEATLKLSSWLAEAMSSDVQGFSKCAETIYNWKDGILNSFDCKYTNGFTEGCNNRIKVLKRNAYGYRNFNRFRNRILHMFQGSYQRKDKNG